ncbi:glycosyltransferase family 4 protein [candidate division WOR-3 bacterium]|uniref:Glycosyltransferase family 4 protein n=1 Tax=candidate division WOR-3 bacterium TaxID=2052148 RepID=A0A938BSJ5_UNCW3|nr:glycosyltransferase family 4 protein [candidate division WOR-3 bacterium]
MTTSHPVRYSRFFDREAVSLARAGYDVRIVGIGSRDEWQSEAGVKLVSVVRRTKRQLIADVSRAAEQESCDIYQCLDPWTLRTGFTLKRRRAGRKLIYESSEWFPRMWLDRRDKPLPTRWLGWLAVTRYESAACRSADAVVETNATRAARFARRGCTPVLVPNYPPLDLLPEPAPDREPWLAWTGLVSRPRGFDRLLQALVPVARRFPAVRLRVIGEFDPRDDIQAWARQFTSAHGIEANVEYLGSLSYQAMFAALRPCLAGLILFQPKRGNDFTGQPNKLFEFMGSGLAVIASEFPEIAPAVREANCGWLVDPRAPEEIAAALTSVLSDPEACRARGEAGRRAVVARYHWGIAERALLGLYARLAE